MKYLVIILGLFFSLGVTAQVVSGEYFFDTEPSQGKGTSFSVTTGKNIEKNLQIPLNGLSPGIHNLFVRVKNTSNVWSHYEGRMFYILPKKPDTAPAITAGEWFVDTDPGIGNGKPFTVNASANLTALNIDAKSLTPGIHNLFIRVKNTSNVWSHYEGRMFYILPKKPDTTPAITAGEWFVDTDPGIGKGTSFSVSSSQINTALSIDTKSLSPGIHNLFIRVKNTSNVWSHYEGRMFYILPNQLFQTTMLQAAEWFIDTDPGIGKGTSVSIASAKEISKAIDLKAQNLSSGKHTLFIRVKNNQGVWSHYEGRGFNVCADLLPKPVLTSKSTACKGADLQLTSNAVIGATTYFWKGPKGYQETGLSATVKSMDSSKIGVYTLFAVRAGGTSCDTSFSSITIGLNNIQQVTNPQIICEGESYSINGKSYKTAGTYSDVFTAKNGCDSIVKTILTVNKRSEYIEIKHICGGDSYKGYNKTGEYTSTFKNKIGCDSIYKLQLTVHEPVVKEESKTICFGTTYKGKSTTGVYTFAFKTAYGCDSTEKLNLTVLKNDTTKINKTICSGESYDGYSKSGFYTYKKKSKLGCDSTVQLTLKVRESFMKEESKTICFGSSYKGKSSSGVYTFAFKTAYGCDSTEKLNLTVLKNDITKIAKTICTGESYEGYSKSGLYTFNKKSLFGCDSTIQLTLTVETDENCKKSDLSEVVKSEFKIYPNPTNNIVKIEINEQLAKMKCTARVMDVLGKEIFRTNLNDVQTEISFRNIEAKGVYLINIYDDKEIRINSERILITD